MDPARPAPISLHPTFQFALLFCLLFLLHAPLLRLPYFWDEAGYYVPAARDLLLTGDPVPHSTVSNAHPPLVMAYLALWWKLSGYKPAVTRTAMLLFAAFGLLGFYRLGTKVADRRVALASVLCLALYPVFFAQSSLALVDLPATALTLWALSYYVERRLLPTVLFFCAAALAKETAILAPLAVSGWEIATSVRDFATLRRALLLLVSCLPLAAWFAWHFARTGYVFGNPGYFQYNVGGTLHLSRIALAALRRLWQAVGYMNLFVLTVAAAAAMIFPALRDHPGTEIERERPRIAVPTQWMFAAIIAVHVVVLSVIGGAPLARYMLTPVALVVLVCVSTVWRRVPGWPLVLAIVLAAFVLGLFINPPVAFSLEDNLAYRDFVLLHKRAAGNLEKHYAGARVLTAWPASDELTKPELGYVQRPLKVVRIENFSAPQVLLAAHGTGEFDVAFLFSTEYEPPRDLLARFPWWERTQARWFGFHRDLPPEVAAQLLGGRIVDRSARNGLWMAVVDMQHAQDAEVRKPAISGR